METGGPVPRCGQCLWLLYLSALPPLLHGFYLKGTSGLQNGCCSSGHHTHLPGMKKGGKDELARKVSPF